MKLIKLLFSIIFMSVFVSCSNDKLDTPTTITGLTEEVYFEEVGTAKSIGLMEHYELLIQQATADNADEHSEFIEYLQGELEAAEDYTDECINMAGANFDVGADGETGKNILLGYKYSTIRYKSIDHKGNPAILSALVVWPYSLILPNADPNNVIIGCHVTYGSNAERPTNYSKNSLLSDVGMLACCAKPSHLDKVEDMENLVIIPDYQGFGATHGDVHPYLSQDLTARQVLDGVRAGIAYFTQKEGKLEKNWRSVSTGYSQGGSVAMAVHRYIEKNNLVSEFNFAGSVCGSGPYDPLATLTKYIETDQIYMPVSSAMMMYSMCKTNPKLMDKYEPKDFLTEKFINAGPIKMIEEKLLNTDQMQEELFQYSEDYNEEEDDKFCMQRLATDGLFHPYRKDTKDKWEWEDGYIRTAWARTTDVLLDDCIEYFQFGRTPETKERLEAMKAIEGALKDNVLYRDWTPAHPIFLYHTEEDEVVVVENYRNCLKAWEGSDMVKGTIYKGATETHVSYGSYFFLYHCGDGIRAILSDSVDDYEFDRIQHGIL